jgi:membrane protease YdiL (CAAX protease family)
MFFIVTGHFDPSKPVAPALVEIYQLVHTNPVVGFGVLFQGAFKEEVLFRLIPLSYCILYEKRRKDWPIVAVLSSIVFGVIHGGLINILFQGVIGFSFCELFMVISKGQPDEALKATLTTTLVHSLFNFITFLIA